MPLNKKWIFWFFPLFSFAMLVCTVSIVDFAHVRHSLLKFVHDHLKRVLLMPLKNMRSATYASDPWMTFTHECLMHLSINTCFWIYFRHPFDSSKWGRICRFLAAEGILDKNHIVEPLEAKREDLLVVFILVHIMFGWFGRNNFVWTIIYLEFFICLGDAIY